MKNNKRKVGRPVITYSLSLEFVRGVSDDIDEIIDKYNREEITFDEGIQTIDTIMVQRIKEGKSIYRENY